MNKPILLLLLLLCLGCDKSKEKGEKAEKLQAIQNPVIRGEFPDPSVIKVGDTFYAGGTSNDWAPIYPIHSSKDLEHWEFENYVFREAPEWTSSGFWAPELYYREGTFYCYYTAKNKDGVSCIGVASTKDIQKGFEDHGVLVKWGSESIDAFVYDDDGQLYVTWKAYGLNPDKPIQILGSKLSNDGLKLEGEVFSLVTAEEDSWERGGIEGQSIVKNGDYLYMLYSGAACCGGGCDYKVGAARAKRMEGPWEKYTGNPVLSDFGDWKCPGHGTPVMSEEENWYYLYHAYAKEGFPYMGRSALLNRFYWDEESGWPYFKAVELMTGEANSDGPLGIKDDFEGGRLAEWWRWDLANYSPDVTISNGQLWLSGNTSTNGSGTLCVVPQKADYKIEVEIEPQTKVSKGLLIYGTHENKLGLGVKGNALTLFEVRRGQKNILNQLDGFDTKRLYLAVKVENGHKMEFSYKIEGKDWLSIGSESNGSTEVTGDFLAFWQWGLKPGIFVEGNEKGNFAAFRLEY